MHSCAEVVARLSDLLDDEVAAGLRKEIEEHLAQCATCQVLFDSTRRTLRLVTETKSIDLPAGLSERILRALRQTITADRDPRSGQP